MHRCELYNCDNMDVLEGLKPHSVNLVLCDPPYNLGLSQMLEYQEHFIRVCTGAIIIFCPPENLWVGDSDQHLFWVKQPSTKNVSRSYSRFVECIRVYGRGAWNVDRHWTQYVNVFYDTLESKQLHPHQKPLSLITRLLLNHSNVGDVVLDPFMGVGTVGIASVTNGRRFIGVEVVESYYDTAESRIKCLM